MGYQSDNTSLQSMKSYSERFIVACRILNTSCRSRDKEFFFLQIRIFLA